MNNKKVLFSIALLLALPGCMLKKGVDNKKNTKKYKKMTLTDKSHHLNKDEGKFFDGQVESYALSEDGLTLENETSLAAADMNDIAQAWQKNENAAGFEPIYFEFNQDKIEGESQVLALDIEAAKKAANEGGIVVAGHSDSHFVSADYNVGVSERRARYVAQQLVKAGIKEDKIKVIAYGDKHKKIDTAAKCKENRRVEITPIVQS